MKTYKFGSTESAFRYPEDVARIVKVCAARDVLVSLSDAELAWDAYSDSMAAGWLFLPESDDELFADVMRYLTES